MQDDSVLIGSLANIVKRLHERETNAMAGPGG
jgi:hypothetical protein